VKGGWFDDPPPHVSRTYLREPVLCHGRESGGYARDPFEGMEEAGPPAPRDCAPRPARTEITTCYLCLGPLGDDVHMDHVLPRSKGGDDSLLMPVHSRCNLLKSNRALIGATRQNRPQRRKRTMPKQGELWKPEEETGVYPAHNQHLYDYYRP
jgi:5-methylcytosine-specific restriction endonuclease McrA